MANQSPVGGTTVPGWGALGALPTYWLDACQRSILFLDVLRQRGNTTRFLVIGKTMPERSGHDLTAAAFTVRRDEAGALYRLLEPFARHGVNLTAVQSRPMKGKPWEYVFFVDMEGHESDTQVGKALDEAAGYAHSHKILGSFPRARSESKPQIGRRA